MIAPVVRDFLAANAAIFTETEHRWAATAIGCARQDHTPAAEMAKTVVVVLDGSYALAVLPANRKIDLARLKQAARANSVRLATEREIARLFPYVEVGAIPPLGRMYNLPLYVDNSLAQHAEIAFAGGSHRDVVHTSFLQFVRLGDLTMCSFSLPLAEPS